jgi:predicted amidohydrolase
MRLAVLQAPSSGGDAEAALSALSAPLTAAGAAGAAVLVAPEIWLPGYNAGSIPAQAQPRGGDWHRRRAALCRDAGCGLVVGYAERDGAVRYNSAVAFDATGVEVAHYRKVQLYGPREKALYTAGDAYTVFDLGGTGAAILICYDVEFAPHVRALAEAGVSLILCPTANMAPNVHVSRTTVPANAVNHRMTIAYANFCGVEGDLTYCGESLVVGPDGQVLAQAGRGPALIVADLIAPDPRLIQTQIEDFRTVRQD